MTILFLLIPLGLLLLAIAVGAFFWATRSGQFDDLLIEHMVLSNVRQHCHSALSLSQVLRYFQRSLREHIHG